MCSRPVLSQNNESESCLYEMIAGLSSQEFEVEIKGKYESNTLDEGDIVNFKELDKNMLFLDYSLT